MSSAGRLKWARIKSENGFEHDGQALLFAKEKGLVNDAWLRALIERVGIRPDMTRVQIADLLESDAQNENGNLVQLAKEMCHKENTLSYNSEIIGQLANGLRSKLADVIKAIRS